MKPRTCHWRKPLVSCRKMRDISTEPLYQKFNEIVGERQGGIQVEIVWFELATVAVILAVMTT